MTTPLIRPIFHGPKVVILTGFHCNTKFISLALLLKHVFEFSKLTLSYNNFKNNKNTVAVLYVNSDIICYVPDTYLFDTYLFPKRLSGLCFFLRLLGKISRPPGCHCKNCRDFFTDRHRRNVSKPKQLSEQYYKMLLAKFKC